MKSTMLFASILLCFAITSCSLSKSQVEDIEWKYNGGYYVKDFFTLKYTNGDTAIIDDSIKTLIIETSKSNSLQRERITIKCIKTGELGYYTGINKVSK